MTALSSAGWIVHDIGLATSLGGTMFGQVALEPSLQVIRSPQERDQLSDKAWNRFGWLQLASHAAFAVPWFVGRSMLSGCEVSGKAQVLTKAKDFLIGASLITGISSFVIGRILGKKTKQGEGPEQVKAEGRDPESPVLEGLVTVLGAINMLSTASVLAVTTLLAMEGNKSLRFSAETRRLP